MDNKLQDKCGPDYRSVHTTCDCGRGVELKRGNASWLQHDCECGTHIRYLRGKMIITKHDGKAS